MLCEHYLTFFICQDTTQIFFVVFHFCVSKRYKNFVRENCLILFFLVFLLRFFLIKKIFLEAINLRKEIRFFFAITIIIFCLNMIIRFMPNPRYKKFLSENNIFAVIEDKYDFKNKIQIINDQFYIPVKLIKKYIDKHIFCDKKESKIVITDENRVIKLK